MKVPGCALCDGPGGTLVFQGPGYRVIHADEAGFPAFYRVVWDDHVAEFSDLAAPERIVCMEAVATVERVLRDQLSPTKVNLAALGNMVPHLHWHVIARFDWDSRFPAPVWAAAVREAPPQRLEAVEAGRPALEWLLAASLGATRPNQPGA
jgi:diadenosine tetraphosphate (Ap4A) HIT family hydrolase